MKLDKRCFRIMTSGALVALVCSFGTPVQSLAFSGLGQENAPDAIKEVKLSEILLPLSATASQEEVAAAEKEAKDIVERVRAGAPFTEEAREHSKGASASNGGDDGYFKRGVLAPAIEEQVFRLQVGAITDPIRRPLGFVILKVTNRVMNEVKDSPQGAADTPSNRSVFTRSKSPGTAIQQAAHESAQDRGAGGDSGTAPSSPKTDPNGAVDILSDTLGVDFGPYLQPVIEQVRRNWYNLIPAEARSPQFKQGKLAIQFVIDKNGWVEGMRLTESSGDVALDRAAWGGIAASNPFRPLPKEFAGRFIALRFRFSYNPDRLPGIPPELK